MDRRNFFKILSATGVLSTGCGTKTDKLIPLLVPDHEIVHGEEMWRAAVCGECGAGCGTLVRIMEAERVIDRVVEGKTEQFRERIAAIKKIEGNPLDPVSGGRLCVRGQAGVQSLYHPDRLRGPMKRSGDRGKAQFAAITWDEAIASAAASLAKARAADPARIVILSSPHAGTRSMALQRFAEALGAPGPVVCTPADFPVERRAAELVFGWKGLPVYDLAAAHHALGVGADFLGGWASPVYYARQFGDFRQGRTHVRGFLTQAESRLSITAAAADRWLPLRPGTEPQFLAAVGRILLDTRAGSNRDKLPESVAEAFASTDVAKNLAACGLEERRVRPIVEDLAKSEAPLIVAGASIVQSNSLDAVIASHYVNMLLGNVGKPGGILAPAESLAPPMENHKAAEALSRAQVVLIDGANPAYTLPRSSGALDALGRAEAVISFSPFVDDSAAWADLLLPDHHALESTLGIVPAVSTRRSIAFGTPFVAPLYGTRAVEETLAGVAKEMEIAYQNVSAKDIVTPLLPAETTYDDVARQGGLWLEVRPQ